MVGNLVGDTSGVHTGNQVGNVVGNVTGDVTGDVTSDNIITTGLESDALTLNVSAISDLTQVVTILTCANNSTANSNKIERSSNSDITFEPSTGILKIPKLLIKYFSTTQTNDYLPILQRQDSLVVSIDQTSSGVLEFGYSPGLNTLKVLNIGRDGKSFEMPNNTNDSGALGYALTISNVTTTPPQTTWAVVPSSSSFVDLSSTQSIGGIKTFTSSPKFLNIPSPTGNYDFSILSLNTGTFNLKKFSELSYNPFSDTLSTPNVSAQNIYIGGGLVVGYCQVFNDSTWITSTYKNSAYYFGLGTHIKWHMDTTSGSNPTIYEMGQSFTAFDNRKGAWRMYNDGSMALNDLACAGNWKIRCSLIFENDSSGNGNDRYVAKIYVGKGSSKTRVLTVDEGSEYVRYQSGLYSTVVCEGIITATAFTDTFYIVSQLQWNNSSPDWGQETSKYDPHNLSISLEYMGLSTSNRSFGISSQ